MKQWSAKQLIDTAQLAIDKSNYQDAVTVLGYLIQNYPDSDQVELAREKYRFLTGSDFAEAVPVANAAGSSAVGQAEGSQAVPTDGTMAGNAGQASPVSAAPSALEQKPADENAQAPEALAKNPSADQDAAAAATGDEAGKEAVPVAVAAAAQGAADMDEALQKSDRVGRMIADLFYGLGWLLLPIGALIVIFSFAFASFLIPGLVVLLLSPVLIGAGQVMWAVFEMRSSCQG